MTTLTSSMLSGGDAPTFDDTDAAASPGRASQFTKRDG